MKPELQNTNSKIYLTGFMGSGKSTVGPLVARRLGWRFCDLDDRVALEAGCAVPVIFEKEGEAGFRHREAKALARVSEEEEGGMVVATGGGTLVQEASLERALRSGFVVYLRASARVLATRLRAAAAERPLLQGASGQPLQGHALTRHIGALLSERQPSYERAHATVDAAQRTPEQTATAVAEHFRRHASPAQAP